MTSNFRGSISTVWSGAVKALAAPGVRELVPLVVTIDEFDSKNSPIEVASVRETLDSHLVELEHQSIDTVANTIFPWSLWNPTKPSSDLYTRYSSILPRLRHASSKNRHGLYFERMISGGPKGQENQLQFALSHFTARPKVRRSMLQVGVFQPGVDHTNAAQRGFPCLQQVSFAPTNGGLAVCAFYAVQYLMERGYGNYLGLCRLGRFVAHELKLPLAKVTCIAGIAELDANKSSTIELLNQMDLGATT